MEIDKKPEKSAKKDPSKQKPKIDELIDYLQNEIILEKYELAYSYA